MNKLSLLILVAFLASCSTRAEIQRYEDASVVRGTYATVSPIVSWATGKYETCQLDLLDKTVQENQELSQTGIALVEDYAINLTPEGCWIVLREQISGGTMETFESE